MNPDITQTERIGEYRMVPYRGRLKAVGDSPGTMGQEFSVGQLPDGRWETSLLNTGERKPPRKQFVARDLGEAVWFAERHWFPAANGASDVGPKGPTIEQVFAEWLDVHPVKRATIESDYLPRTDLFAKWAKANGLEYWWDLYPTHLQQYANEGAEGKRRSYISKRCRVVSMAAEYVRENYPRFHRPLPFKLPKGKDWGKPKSRITLTFEEVAEFLSIVRAETQGWRWLSGFALTALASARTQEVRRLLWRSVDLVRGLVWFEAEPKSGIQSYRQVPVPGLLLDILKEAAMRLKPSPDEYVVPTPRRDAFGRAFRRYVTKWRPGLSIEPYGLRRTLVKDFVLRGLHSYTLEIYRGHKPRQISTVEWVYYLDRLQLDPEGVEQMFREQIVKPLDEILEPLRAAWNESSDRPIWLSA